MELSGVYDFEHEVESFDNVVVTITLHNMTTIHEVLCDSVQQVMGGLHRQSHDQNLWLECPKIDADREGEARAFLIIWNTYNMPTVLLDI